MSEFKGTRGEWKLQRDCTTSIISEMEGELIEGNIICDAPEGFEKSMESWAANAKLITCAPEMLGMLDLLTTVYSADNIEKAKQLIKKATE